MSNLNKQNSKSSLHEDQFDLKKGSKTFFSVATEMFSKAGFPKLFESASKDENHMMDSYLEIIFNNQQAINSLKNFKISRKRKHPEFSDENYWNYDTVCDYVLNINDTIELLKGRTSSLKNVFDDETSYETTPFWSDLEFDSDGDIVDPQSFTSNFTVDVNHNINLPFIGSLFGSKKKNEPTDDSNDPSLLTSVKEKLGEVKPGKFLSSIFGSEFVQSIWDKTKYIVSLLGDYGILIALIIIAGVIMKKGFRPVSTSFLILCKIIIIVCIVKGTYHLVTGKFNDSMHGAWIKLSKHISNWLNFYKMQKEYNDTFPDDVDDLEGDPLDVEPQSMRDYGDGLSNSIILLCSGLIGYKTKNPFSTTLMKFISTTNVQRENLVSGILTVSDLFAKLLKKMTAPENITEFFEIDVVDPYKVKPILEEISQYCSDSNAGLDVIDPLRDVSLVSLDERARKILSTLDSKSYDYRCLTSSLRELEKRKLNVESVKKALKGDRVEPVGVLMMGKSSVKKSILLGRLSKMFTYATIPESWQKDFTQNPESYMYIKPSDKFYDGYNYQCWTTLMDDAFQKRSVAGAESSEEYDVIKMINTHAYCLSTANVDGKNKDYFRSAAVFANTNRQTTNLKDMQSVLEWKAVVRRFKILVDIDVNPKYKNDIGQVSIEDLPSRTIVDFNSLGHDLTGTFIPDDYWIITPYKFDPHAVDESQLFVKQESISYEELVERTIQNYKDNVNNYYMNKFENMRSFERLRPKIKEKFGDNLHEKGKWFDKADPVDEKFKQTLVDILTGETDIEMIPLPQSKTTRDKRFKSEMDFLSDIENIKLEGDFTTVQDSFLNREKDEWFSAAPEGSESFDRHARIMHCANLFNIQEDHLDVLSDHDLDLLCTNLEIQEGFTEERTSVFRVNRSSDRIYGIGMYLPVSSHLIENDTPEYFESKKYEGAMLHVKFLRSIHPIKLHWFKDKYDPILKVEVSASAFWFRAVKQWDAIFDLVTDFKKNTLAAKFLHKWFSMCDVIGRSDFKDHPVEEFLTFFHSLYTDEAKETLFSHFGDLDLFFAFMLRIFQKRMNAGLHPLSNEVEFPEYESSLSFSRNIWIRIVSGYNKFKNWIRENYAFLIGLLAVGSGLVVGIYFMVTAVHDFFFPDSKIEQQNLIPQSVDNKTMMKHSSKKLLRPKINNAKNYVTLDRYVSSLPAVMPQGLFNMEFATKIVPRLDFSDFGKQGGANDTIAKVMNKYFFIMYVTFKEGDEAKVSRFGQCSNLLSRYFYVQLHYAFTMKDLMDDPKYEGGTITFINPLKTIVYKMTCEDFINNLYTTRNCGATDQGLLFIRTAQINSTGIYKYLVTEKDLSTLAGLSAIDVSIVSSTFKEGKDGDLGALVIRDKHTQASPMAYQEINKIFEGTTKEGIDRKSYPLPRSWKYNQTHAPGDCGALIFCRTGNFQNRVIVGSHDAGGEKFGVGCMLSKEIADELLSAFNDPMISKYLLTEESIVDDLSAASYTESPVPQGNFLSTVKIDPEYQWSGPHHSRIKRSEIYGKLPEPYDFVNKAPAKMRTFENSEGDVINPMKNAIEEYGPDPPCVDFDVLAEASNDYLDCILKATSTYKYPRTMWSLDQALRGFNKVKGISPSTSSGWPLNTGKTIDVKHEYFRAIAENDEKLEREMYIIIEHVVGNIFSKFKNRQRPFFMFIDFLKDELRSLEKVSKGKTRLVSGADFFLVIVFRMCFGAFMDAFTEFNIELGSAVGVNPYSDEWDQIARRLTKFGKFEGLYEVLAGDFAKYDAKQTSVIMNEALDVIIGWYKAAPEFNIEHQSFMTFCWAEITNSRHLFENFMVEWYTSMASGNPITTMVNTICNNIIIRVCWINAGFAIILFRDKVYFIALGDDHALTVHHDYIDKFNELTLPDLMAQIGHKYTTENKLLALFPSRDLSQIEFLKRRWVYNNRHGRYIAPLNMDSISGMLNFTKKGAKANQITMDNIATALRELSLQGRNVYDSWYPKLMELARTHFPNMGFSGSVHHDYNLALKETLDSEFEW